MTYQDRFKSLIARMKSKPERYNQININTQNENEERILSICQKFWGPNTSAVDFNIKDDMDKVYANHLLEELEELLDKGGW